MTTLFGAWAELGTYTTINSILARFNVADAVWQSVIAQLGDPGNDVALFSALPHTAILAACGLAQTDQGPLTPLQATQVGLVWRMSRRVLAFRSGIAEADFSDLDLWAVQDKSPPEAPVKNPQGTSGLKESVLKMSAIIDQCDDSELLPPDETKLNQWIHAYISVMGAAPEESEEPTGAQLAALHKRVLVNMSAPYTDFAIWTPFGRRMSKIHKARVYTPLGDGSYLYKDLPGPASFQAWTSSWKVFKTACLMLNIVNLAALEAYYRTIERMVIQYPGADLLSRWHSEGWEAGEDQKTSDIWSERWKTGAAGLGPEQAVVKRVHGVDQRYHLLGGACAPSSSGMDRWGLEGGPNGGNGASGDKPPAGRRRSSGEWRGRRSNEPEKAGESR